MDTVLAEQGPRLTYLRNPSQSETFDPCRILDDVCEDGMAGAMLPWQNGLRMAGSDHLILASGAKDGRCLGVIAATDLATDRGPFLFVDAAYLAPVARSPHLLHRMLAFALLRIAGEAPVPTVIAACVQTPAYARSLRAFGQHFTAAALFPAGVEDVVIDLGMASLARRIARIVRPGSRQRTVAHMVCTAASVANLLPGNGDSMDEMLVVVDLTAMEDAAILDDARKLYRARQRSVTRQGVSEAIASTARAPQPHWHDATAH